MRLVQTGVVGAYAVALLAPVYPLAVIISGLTIGVAFRKWGLRNAAFLFPLVFAGPVLVSAFGFSFFFRAFFLLIFALLALWALRDLELRTRGAPVIGGRIEFFFLSGIYALVVALSAIAPFSRVPSWTYLLAAACMGAFAVSVLRLFAEQMRAAHEISRTTPLRVDAAVVGLLFAEAFLVLSFLPLSPFTVGAVLTVLLWAVATTIADLRTGGVHYQRLVRVSLVALGAVAVLFVSVPWFSLR